METACRGPRRARIINYEEVEEPTINDVVKTLFMIRTNILQIMAYMVRWLK